MIELILGIIALITPIVVWFFSSGRIEKENEASVIKEIDEIIRTSKNIDDLVNGLSVNDRNKLLAKYLRK